MRTASRATVITGLGAVCALAEDHRSLWPAIESGREGIGTIRRFSTEGFEVHTGALVASCADPDVGGRLGTEGLCRRFSERAAREAMDDAGLGASDVPAHRIGLVFGTGLGGGDLPIHGLVRDLAEELGVRGPCLVVSTACSSSTGALALARDLLALDAADVVICGGADVLSPEVFSGFYALGVLNPERCAPFSFPVGTTLGEGAGFVVLEHDDRAGLRGARARAVVAGSGLSGDAFHETSPDPTGSGVERALRGALLDAGLTAGDIGYVNVHGSGTQANDPSEWLGIQRGLGERAMKVAVSSTKGALGHAQGAAGVLEAIVTILGMERGMVPPTLHFTRARPHVPGDPVGGDRPRAWDGRHALCLNSAFGGSNAAVVLSRPGTGRNGRARAGVREVAVYGLGLVGPYGLGTEALARAGATSAPGGAGGDRGPLTGRVPAFDIERLVRTADPRDLDPMSRFLTAAAAQALREAGLSPRGAMRDRIGLFLGAVMPSPESLSGFRRSIDERGLLGIAAASFARIVLNAPAGFCSKLLSLRGPLSTVSAGAGSGLAAIALAAEQIAGREGVDWMVAAGVDERAAADVDPDDSTGTEGAVAVLLGAVDADHEGTAKTRKPDVRLIGWGIAGPGRIGDAVAGARAGAGGPSERIDAAPTAPGGDASGELTFDEDDWAIGVDRAQASPSALACAAAVLALRRDEAERALVTSGRDAGMSVALLLTR